MNYVEVTRAIVRRPATSLAGGITNSDLGPPDPDLTTAQHRSYCDALRSCGVEVIVLEAEEGFPDSTFVEDTAVIAGGHAVITRPGHPSRLGEETLIESVLSHYVDIDRITPPGRIDGGDVLEIDGAFLVGLSKRTDEEGANQLCGILGNYGHSCRTVHVGEMLHLKSGISYLGGGIILADPSLAGIDLPEDTRIITISEGDEYCANSILVNGRVLFPSGHPRTREKLSEAGLEIVELDMSEFQKMDGGLSCLSLRMNV